MDPYNYIEGWELCYYILYEIENTLNKKDNGLKTVDELSDSLLNSEQKEIFNKVIEKNKQYVIIGELGYNLYHFSEDAKLASKYVGDAKFVQVEVLEFILPDVHKFFVNNFNLKDYRFVGSPLIFDLGLYKLEIYNRKKNKLIMVLYEMNNKSIPYVV